MGNLAFVKLGPEYNAVAKILVSKPTEVSTKDAIVTAFRNVFGGGAVGPAGRADYLQDGDELTRLFDEAVATHPGIVPSTRVDRIRFVDANNADVRFQLGIGGGPGPMFEGRAVRRDGAWLVARETALRVLGAGGTHLRGT